MPRAAKYIFGIVIALILVAIANLVGGPGHLMGIRQPEDVAFSDLFQRIASIESINVEAQSGDISGRFRTGDPFVSRGPSSDSPAWAELIKADIDSGAYFPIRFVRPPALQNILGLLSMIALPLMLFALVYFLLLRPAQLKR